jgi:hypothetical protein
MKAAPVALTRRAAVSASSVLPCKAGNAQAELSGASQLIDGSPEIVSGRDDKQIVFCDTAVARYQDTGIEYGII